MEGKINMQKIKEAIENIGMKKICLFAHYGLAIFASLLYFIVCIVCAFIPTYFGIDLLLQVYKTILIYCGVVVVIITIKSVFDDMQTINNPNSKFDVIGFIIGVSLFTTLGLIIVCIKFMFEKQLTEIEFQMWKHLLSIFGGMFITEAGGGYIYKIFKNKFKNE